VTAPYALQIANKGYKQACLDNPALLTGMNTLDGNVTFKGVAESLDLPYRDSASLLKEPGVTV
jgi:alanine dehydrogenase